MKILITGINGLVGNSLYKLLQKSNHILYCSSRTKGGLAKYKVDISNKDEVNSERKIFPGYILIKMNLNDDTWHIIKNTPKLSGFLGNKGKPIPISNDEAKRISDQVIDGVEKSRPAIMYDVGEQVKVIDGPFASFNGQIEQIDEEKARLRVAVSIFGRSTPVDLEYSQVEKV